MGLHLDLQKGRGRITSDHDLEIVTKNTGICSFGASAFPIGSSNSLVSWFRKTLFLLYERPGLTRRSRTLIGDHIVLLTRKHRFMSIILGRWPLIPDQNCTVRLSHDMIGSTTSDANAPNVFCERRL